jgi:hypothetical protein
VTDQVSHPYKTTENREHTANISRSYRYYLLPYFLHGAEHCLKRRLSLSLSKNILLSYGTRRFITVFTKVHHWTLSWASRIQFAPSILISPRSSLMLFSHLRLGLPSYLLLSGLPTTTL